MQNIIVETKLRPPIQSPGLIPREKLIKRLREGRRRQITCIVGPAGYGKTTLALLWRQELISLGHDIAWLSLSRDDAELDQFIAYLLASIQQSVPEIGKEAELKFNRESSDNYDSYIASLINDIQHYPREIYLVLDDYHAVKNPVIDGFLAQLINFSPSNFHLILVSREMPGFSLAKPRIHDQLTEIDFSELRLSYVEAADFIAQQNATLGDKEMRVIYELTDGWVSGLQLICIALKRTGGDRQLVASRLNKVQLFSEYLESEVLSFMPDEDVDFLVKISSCRKFSADLGEYITGSPRASEIISRAEAANLFLIPLETSDGFRWFRYHPLLSRFLTDRLAKLPQEQVKSLNRRAFSWFVEHDLLAEAVRHALYAGDYDAAVEMIERCGRQIFLSGQIKTLFTWCQKIPRDVMQGHFELQFLIVWSLLFCRRIDAAEEVISTLSAQQKRMSSKEKMELKLLYATLLLEQDDTIGMLEALEGTEGYDNDIFGVGGRANILSIGQAYAGFYEKSRDTQRQVRRLDNYDTNLMRYLIGECSVGMSFAFQGDMQQADRTYREILAVAEEKAGLYSDPFCFAVSYMSEVLYETDRWEDARKLLLARLDIIDRVALPDGLIKSYVTLARIDYFSGRINEAKSHLEALQDLGHKHKLERLVAHSLYESLRIALSERRHTEADELIRVLSMLGENCPQGEHSARAEIAIYARYGKIRILFDDGKWEEALSVIDQVSEVVEGWRRYQDVVRVKLMRAIVFSKTGKMEEALALAEQCLISCQRLGLIRSVLDEGPNAMALVVELATRNTTDPLLEPFIQQLLWAADQHSPAGKSSTPKMEQLAEPLSDREMEILTLLARSLTNKKIALSIGVTPETVKWHLKNIYAKLAVSSRDEAVARGRDLGLLAMI